MKNSLINSIKAGVYFGITMGVFFGVLNIPFYGARGLLKALYCMLISGTLFGLLIFIFTYIQSKKFKGIKDIITKTESIVFDDAANHFVGKEAVGGWLFLTKKSLLFMSHKYNVNNHTLEIHINEISKISGVKRFSMKPNAILVEIKDGQKEKFVVNNPALWIKQIENLHK